jgi:hypothetical protein
VADVPEYLTLRRHRDLEGIANVPWMRWIVVTAIAVLSVLGLLNVFGQRPVTSTAAGPGATLTLYAPEHLRGGLLFSARFHIRAHRDIHNAILILGSGWAEGMAINTIEPSPVGEASSNGRLSFQLGHIPSGTSYVLYMQFQVNPTNLAWRRSANVTLADGSTPILRIAHHVTVYP